ncbi:hypothetical protein KSP39_PZI006759 [Platanthera zijinensis]|uniref:Transposase n=1 Tax=Platanthera zijinensis TaxID=2320716 RepID=A0AAP0BNQ2_9ASPA
MCELPFSIVDHSAFRIMIQNLQPEFNLNHKTAKTKDILQLYRKEKKILQDLILKSKGRISLTTDTWTSIQTMCYMSITAHYIDENWKLQKKIINFLHLDERHTGIILSLTIEKCLAEWRIEDKLCALVLDNVSANNIVASTLKGRYRLSLPLAGKYFHIRCSAHILNLIVKEGLKELDDNIVRIRDAVKFVLSSPQRLKVFDCVTRWNSTYHMLKRALEHKDVFYRFNLIESFKHPPTENDWSIAQELCNFLKVFDDSTNIFSAIKTPTANLYFFQVCMIQLHLKKNWNSILISKMQVAMLEKFTQYWENYSMVLAIAVVLDPRRKLDFVAFCYTKVYNDSSQMYVKAVFDELSKLFDWYEEKVNSSRHHSVASDFRDESSSLVSSNEDLSMNDFLKFKAETRKEEESKTELEIYLQEPFSPDDAIFDILKWWEVNESKFQILAAMARDILSIPVSTVASESAFSTGSRVIQKKRTCLKPYTIQALICLQDWLREKFSNPSMSNGKLHNVI